jgi:hypothetical protein
MYQTLEDCCYGKCEWLELRKKIPALEAFTSKTGVGWFMKMVRGILG